MKYLTSRGYFAHVPVAKGPLIIGGKCRLAGAVSPNTGRPLMQHASVLLKPDSFSIPDWKAERIHLLYSWTCNIHLEDFSYRQTSEAVTVLEYKAGHDDGDPDDPFPYEDYPEAFPAVPGVLEPMSERDQAIILHINGGGEHDFAADSEYAMSTPGANDLSYPRHQFGGVPLLLQGDAESKNCVECHREMPLIASIANDTYSNEDGFFGDQFVQILYWCCTDCQIIAARNYCD